MQQVILFKSKLVFLGDENCGKSSIISRVMLQQFQPSYNPTIGVDFTSKTYTRNTQSTRLQIWDTAGQQRFVSLIPSYIRDSEICVVVVDLSNIGSLNSISKWANLIETNGNLPLIKLVLGTKNDIVKDSKSAQIAKENANKLNFLYRSVSAKTGQNINTVFDEIIDLIMTQKFKEKASPQQNVKNIKPPEIKPLINQENLSNNLQLLIEGQVNKQLKPRVTSLEQKVKELEEQIDSLLKNKPEGPKKLGKNFAQVLMMEATKEAIKVCSRLPCPCFERMPSGFGGPWQSFGQWAIIHKEGCDSCRQILKEYTIKYCQQKIIE